MKHVRRAGLVLVLALPAGIAGAQEHALAGEAGFGGPLDFKGPLAAGLKLSLARTWGSPVGTRPGLTYVGPELDLSAMHVSVTVGPLFRVAGAGGDAGLFSWGLGVRF